MQHRIPPPVYADGTSLLELGTAELFIVTVLRLWAADHGDAALSAGWRSGFQAAGVEPAGAQAFGSLMRVVAGVARHPLWVHERRCRRLGHDEALLLQLTSLMQADRVSQATAILAGRLMPEAARPAAGRAYLFAAALRQAGLVVPLRHAEAAGLSRLAVCAHATRGLALVQ